MTKITIYKNPDGSYAGFHCEGHAGFADKGEDLVCCGISTLVINAVNSIERLTEDEFSVDSGDGIIAIRFEKAAGSSSTLLIESMLIWLEGIISSYCKKYITLRFEEV